MADDDEGSTPEDAESAQPGDDYPVKPIEDPGWFTSADWKALALRFGTATVDQLEKEPAPAATDKEIQAQLDKAAQTHGFREKFFSTISRVMVGTLVASGLIMLLYLISQWGHVSAAAVISFNGAVVVNVLGLALILANYLFPKGGGD